MPLPETLLAMTQKRRFWSDFTFETESLDDGDYPEWHGQSVVFSITGMCKLSMYIGNRLNNYQLELLDGEEDDGRPHVLPLGHDDLAYPHPHSLRWEELDLLCRAIAHNDPTLPHPGLPLLLLQRWAPICPDDDADRIAGLLREAWKKVGITSDEDIHRLVEIIDARDAGFKWIYDEVGKHWWIHQEGGTSVRELYSYRSFEGKELDGFPAGKWEEMLQEAKELVGRNPLIDDDAAPRFRLRMMRKYTLDLPLRRGDTKILMDHVQLVAVVDVIFKAFKLGAVILNGQRGDWSTGEYVPHTASYKLRVYEDEADRAVKVLKDTIRWSGAPEDDLELACEGHGIIPFDMDPCPEDNPDITRDLFFVVAQVSAGNDGQVEVDFDMKPSTKIWLQSLASHLSQSSDEAQDSFKVSLPDGGVLEFKYTQSIHIKSDAPCLFVIISNLSNKASEALFDFLRTRGLTLLPPLIMPTEAAENPPSLEGARRVKTAIDFHKILQKGPIMWWYDTQYGREDDGDLVDEDGDYVVREDRVGLRE
jgi:hypothetical protein